MICITDPHLLAYAQEHFPEILSGKLTIGCVTLDIEGLSTLDCKAYVRGGHSGCRCDSRRWAILGCLLTLQAAIDFPDDPTSPEALKKLQPNSTLN